MEDRSNLESVLEEVFVILKKAGFRVNTISYPKERRSFDIIGSREFKRVVFKITLNTKHLSRIEYVDLKKVSRAYKAFSVIISERDEEQELGNDLVVKSKGLNIISIELLKRYLLNGEKPIVYKLRGNLLVRIDPVKFKEIRLQYGYSLGELADKIGVSRKAVYEYEHGQIAVSIERAVRIAEILGEDVFKPIDILGEESREQQVDVENDLRSRSTVSRIFSELCSELNIEECLLYKLMKTPVDYVLKVGETIYSIIFKTNDFKDKIDNALKVTSIFKSKEFIAREVKDLFELKNEILGQLSN